MRRWSARPDVATAACLSFGLRTLARCTGPCIPKGAYMSRQIVFTPKAAKPPATYSQAVKAAGLVFVSGTAPQDTATGQIIVYQVTLRYRSH